MNQPSPLFQRCKRARFSAQTRDQAISNFPNFIRGGSFHGFYAREFLLRPWIINVCVPQCTKIPTLCVQGRMMMMCLVPSVAWDFPRKTSWVKFWRFGLWTDQGGISPEKCGQSKWEIARPGLVVLRWRWLARAALLWIFRIRSCANRTNSNIIPVNSISYKFNIPVSIKRKWSMWKKCASSGLIEWYLEA